MFDQCYICKVYADCETHHLLNGRGIRPKADKYGLTIKVCPWCHRKIHDNPKQYLYLKQEAQRKAMEENGWTTEDFIREFGKNYL